MNQLTRRNGYGFGFGRIALVSLAVGAAVILAIELPEIRRYVKMMTM